MIYADLIKLASFIVYPHRLKYDYNIVDASFSSNRKHNYYQEDCKSAAYSNIECRLPKEGQYLRLRLETFITERGLKCKLHFSTRDTMRIGYVSWHVNGQNFQNTRIYAEWEGISKQNKATWFSHLKE